MSILWQFQLLWTGKIIYERTAGLRQRLAELADINKKIIVEEAVKVLVLVLAVVIILVAAIFSVKAIDRHNESIAVNNIRKEIIDGR